ncbi:MAG: glycosyltransferase [Streptosporangiaceae bacterium]
MILPKVSIVVPAHNEATSLAAGLPPLLAVPGEFDVIVVANGCADGTAEVARRAGARVLETARPGKAHALRLGDAACTVFPRLYLDADVLITAASVRALLRAAAEPGVLACAPRPVLDLSGAGRVARRVHRVHDLLIAPTRVLAGAGAYLLTEEGHGRVFPLPDVLADDGWAQASFAPHERRSEPAATTVVRPARTVGAHLRRRIRVRSGNRQLAELGRPAPEGRLGLGDLAALVRRREAGPVDAGCYLGVLLLDRALTATRRGPVSWGSDTGSRR